MIQVFLNFLKCLMNLRAVGYVKMLSMGRLSKNANHHGWSMTRNFKIALAKTPLSNPSKKEI